MSAMTSHGQEAMTLMFGRARPFTVWISEVSGMLLLLLLLGAGPAAARTYTYDYCLATDPRPFSNFGTRAAYEASGPRLDPSPVRLSGCKPLQIWHLGRHGTRYGSETDIKSILKLPKLQEQIQQNKAMGRSLKLCDEDVRRILEWSPDIDESLAYNLAPQGERDLQKLGQRLRSRFPDVFEGQDEANLEFKYDGTQRCKQSTKWLRHGLLGSFPDNLEDGIDSLPDFYNRCPAYLGPLAKDFVTGDFNNFRKGPEFSAMIRRVSSRLGFYHNLDIADITSMYDACSFEQAQQWDSRRPGAWCAVFRPQDFEVLEFWYDMREFYRTGYGHSVHEKLGCVPVKDMVKAFKARTDRNSAAPPSGIFYSSHDTLLNQVITYLGLFRDAEKMRETNFATMAERQWRVTRFSPFASNIGAVLHECSSGERYRVQLFLNENPLALEGCDQESRSCTWSQFMAKFGGTLDKCKKRRLCWGI